MPDRLARIRARVATRLIQLRLDDLDAARREAMAPHELAELIDLQRGRCLICLEKHEGALGFDFSPTGDFRGVVCDPCRSGVAYFGDDPVRMRRAAMYVEEKSGPRRRMAVGPRSIERGRDGLR